MVTKELDKNETLKLKSIPLLRPALQPPRSSVSHGES
jgi:hypothetical protein